MNHGQMTIYLTETQKTELKELQKEIKNKGCNISITELIRDSVDIMLAFYKEDVVSSHAPHFYVKRYAFFLEG